MHGICADDVEDISYDTRALSILEHLKNGGHVLGYGHTEKADTIFHNPRMFPSMMPWLFPYGLGGLENELASVVVPRRTQLKHLMNYHDRRFQQDPYFPFIAYVAHVKEWEYTAH